MNETYIKTIVSLALAEDLGSGDMTTNNLIRKSAVGQANIVFKSDGIVCGLGVVDAVFKKLSKKIKFQRKVSEGAGVKKGKVVAVIQGPARAILTGERVALNFLTHLSAIATTTRAFVDQIKPYRPKIMDTRKTTPLLRPLERYAVRIGGGHNHRFDLSQMTVVKDNHRFLLSSPNALIGDLEVASTRFPIIPPRRDGNDKRQGSFRRDNLIHAIKMVKTKTKKIIELEVDTLEQLQEALQSAADIILLDNMSPHQVRQAVIWRYHLKSKILLEASGNIRLNNVRAYAKSGVDRISVGCLTASPQTLDISLDLVRHENC